MKDKVSNPPAFPLYMNSPTSGEYHADGLSLRDYFAAKAMQAMIQAGNDTFISNARQYGVDAALTSFDEGIASTPAAAYRMADMMLAEREKEVSNG